MTCPPRLALAIPPTGPEPAFASVALLAGLAARHWRVQHFGSRARPFGSGLVRQVTGLPGRHLDAWLMPPDVCRGVFARGASGCGLAMVEGTLDQKSPPAPACHCECPGLLRPIAEALDLPIVAVVECRRLEGLHLPALAPEIEAILLDGLEEPADFEPIRRMFQLALRRPVLGAVEALPEVRAELRRLPAEAPLPENLRGRMVESVLRFTDLSALRALAEGRRSEPIPDDFLARPGRTFRVAYAHDEAFGGYFPDTLETLEALGAELVEFSPLRDEALPGAADLVLIGCGYPDRHADALAANVSMIAALRQHVCRGQRIYSEGGGTAYLGRQILVEGRRVSGAGILPFIAELQPHPRGPTPVTRILTQDGWLGPRGTVVRGYRSGRWKLHPASDPGDCPARSGPLTQQHDLYFRHHAVGGLIHLHLAALPEVVAAFAGPHRPSLTLPRTWQ